MPNTPNLRAVIERFGLTVTSVERQAIGAGDVLLVVGNFPDGMAFTARTAPFRGDPERRAAVLAGQLLADHTKRWLDFKADDLALARNVAIAWIEGRNSRMALAEKAANIAARVKAVPEAIEKRLDALLPRLDAAERQGHAGCDGLEAHIGDLEAGVAATEGVVRTLSNTPFGSSGGSSTS